MSMRTRLILTYLLVGLAAIISLVVFVRVGTRAQLQQYMVRGGMVGAEGLVNRLEDYYAEVGSWDNVDSIFRGGMMGPGEGMMMVTRQRIQIVDTQGKLFYDNDQRGYSLPPFSAAKLNDGIALENTNGETVGYLFVDGGGSPRNLDSQPLLRRLNLAALRAALVALLLSLVAALLFSDRILRPVSDLTRAAERLSTGDLTQRVPVRGHDELTILASTFNGMTESLQHSEERRRAMTADIAHELRTPLAVQRAQIEAMQDGIYTLSTENLQTVLDQNELLSRLVDDLRTLALADAGELSLERTWVSVPDLIDRVTGRFRAAAKSHKIQLETELVTAPGSQCPPVWGDPVRLEQILNNLLSNALRFTPDGGMIALRASCSAAEVMISVRDTGPGIQAELLPHVFERFYRADRARNREEGGSGLGLAIARHLALAHAGTLDAGNHPDGGAIFTLRLPVIQQP
ncbi:MAG TPA: ATP-binding protein [Anaerolineaceae bacterium]